LTTERPHIFMTRFNLPTNRVEQSIFSGQWLIDRMRLFQKYTLPSIDAIQDQEVYWLIYLDQQSPEWLKQDMAALAQRLRITPRYLSGSLTQQDIHDDVIRVTSRRSGTVTTSNLDNDDGVARDFVARARAISANSPVPSVTYLVNGAIATDDRVFRRVDRRNAFAVVADELDSIEFRSCWAAFHNRLSDHMPANEVGGPPAWLQVVHGQNVSNRIRGRRERPSEFRDSFPALLEDMREPSTVQLVSDNWLRRPLRQARELTFVAGGSLARKVLGDRALESIKLALRRVGRRKQHDGHGPADGLA
jgi:hypothetical protein